MSTGFPTAYECEDKITPVATVPGWDESGWKGAPNCLDDATTDKCYYPLGYDPRSKYVYTDSCETACASVNHVGTSDQNAGFCYKGTDPKTSGY